jgi:glucokinase
VHLLGIEIGGSKLQLVLGDESGRVQHRRKFTVDRARGGAGIREQIQTGVTEWRREFAIGGVGCGYGGPVDWQTGRICCSHHVEGWNDFPLGAWLRDLAGAPARVDNDTNTAALAEARLGAGAGLDPVFYTNSGSGVGGGLVVAGRIYHGAKPGEAELGHVRLDKSGAIVEERCSGWAVDRRIRGARAAGERGPLMELVGDAPGGEARQLPEALRRGDPLAAKILGEAGDDLAFALSHVVHLFHPAVIVLGGGLAQVGEPWRAAVASALPRYVMGAFQPAPPVRLSALGEDAVPVGALLLAADARRV